MTPTASSSPAAVPASNVNQLSQSATPGAAISPSASVTANLSPSPSPTISIQAASSAQSGSSSAQGVTSTTGVTSQQSVTIQQGTNSSGNTANVALNVNVDNQGSAQASSGQASASGQVGGTSLSITVATTAVAGQQASTAQISTAPMPSASASPASGATPAGTTVPGSSTSGLLVVANNSAGATSGSATAVGVIADTAVIGNQAVVLHIPANTSNQVAQVTLNATLTNNGFAFSQSGNVAATGLQGNATLALGVATPAASVSATTTIASSPSVDLRDSNYALATTGDALAIGVKADTVVQGTQRIIVIIDDNSSGNRIQIIFHVVIANQGSAQAISGQASATGQAGNLQVQTGNTGASAGAFIDSNGISTSGNATAIGVDARTLIDALQSIDLEVGNNSSNNQVDAAFNVDVSNKGSAVANGGSANATGLTGNVQVGPGTTAAPWLLWSAANGSANINNRATGVSGNANSTGLVSTYSINDQESVNTTLQSGLGNQPYLSISDTTNVYNIGISRSTTGNVSVIAQVVPQLAIATTADGQPSASPSATTSSEPSASGRALQVTIVKPDGGATSQLSLPGIPSTDAADPRGQQGSAQSSRLQSSAQSPSAATGQPASGAPPSAPANTQNGSEADKQAGPSFHWLPMTSKAVPQPRARVEQAVPQDSATAPSTHGGNNFWTEVILLLGIIPALLTAVRR